MYWEYWEMVEGWLYLNLTNEIMLLVWTLTMCFAIWLPYKTNVYSLHIIAAGIIPQLIYRFYSIFDLWPNLIDPHVYARLADISLCISIVLALWLALRGMYRGEN